MNTWIKRNSSSGVFRRMKEQGGSFRGVRREDSWWPGWDAVVAMLFTAGLIGWAIVYLAGRISG